MTINSVMTSRVGLTNISLTETSPVETLCGFGVTELCGTGGGLKKGFVRPCARFVARGAIASHTSRTRRPRCEIWYISIGSQTNNNKIIRTINIVLWFSLLTRRPSQYRASEPSSNKYSAGQETLSYWVCHVHRCPQRTQIALC